MLEKITADELFELSHADLSALKQALSLERHNLSQHRERVEKHAEDEGLNIQEYAERRKEYLYKQVVTAVLRYVRMREVKEHGYQHITDKLTGIIDMISKIQAVKKARKAKEDAKRQLSRT